MKRLLSAVLLLFIANLAVAGEDVIKIQAECVYLNEILDENYPAFPVQCGFMPGDEKNVPASVVISNLKRNGLTPPEMPAVFRVARSGYMLTEEALRQELSAVYAEKYPDKDIRVESVRFGREIHIPEDSEHALTFDVRKFGSANASLAAGNVRANFNYVVKVYEEGYVTTDRIKQGDSIDGKIMPELLDVTNLRGTLVKDPAGLVASKSLVRGKALTEDMVGSKPERIKGDPILLVYNDGTIRLEIMAIAEGNAVVGKTFPVKNPSSGKVFTAVYRGNGVATTGVMQ